MKKALIGLTAAATLAMAAVGSPAPAQAHDGLGVGIAAGLLGGALIGGALAGPGYYGPGYYYGSGYYPGYYGPRYYRPAPAYVVAPGCFWQRQRFWDGFAWRIRRVRVCD